MLDRKKLQIYMDGFIRLLTQNGETIMPLARNSIYKSEEHYKFNIANNASELLYCAKWSKEMIGSGVIYKMVRMALGKAGNLVNYHLVNHFDNCCHNNIKEAEQSLYALYYGYDEKKAFEQLVSFFGRRYSLIAFLFFIYDKDRYLPISPDNFDRKFARLGIEFKCSGKCTWNNYTEFIGILRNIQDCLNSYICEGFTLLDAHSFVWMIEKTDEYLKGVNYEKYSESVVKTRIGQGDFRNKLSDYWECSCSVTGCNITEMIEAAHIKPWSECVSNNEHLDLYNGMMLTPNLHKAFDLGLISFDDEGTIMISNCLSLSDATALGINRDMKLRKISEGHIRFLKWHRKNVYK